MICKKVCDHLELSGWLQENEACPGFALDYRSQSCYRLQRNTAQEELEHREGFNYFQKMCLNGKPQDCCKR